MAYSWAEKEFVYVYPSPVSGKVMILQSVSS